MNASSTCAFSMPVWRHWSVNFAFERLVTILMLKIETGTVISATNASVHEIVNIMIITAAIDSVDVSS